MAEPPRKQLKRDIDTDLLTLKAAHLNEIREAIRALTGSLLSVHPFELQASNADDNFRGIAFSEACCKFRYNKPVYQFGSLFLKGFTMLEDLLLAPAKLPDDLEEKQLLKRLLDYFGDTENQQAFWQLTMDRTEAAITAVLAEHILSHLGLGKEYTIVMNTNRLGKSALVG